MKILIVGNHNPHFVNTMVYRQKAVEYLGHDLIVFDDRQFMIPGRIRSKIEFLHQWDLKRINEQLINFVKEKRPDACFIVGGQRILPSTVQEIRKMAIPLALWTTDVPIDFKNVLEAAPFYDQLFCAGSEACDIFHRQGFKNVKLVPFGCDPHFHKEITSSANDKRVYGKDIVFVGSYYPNRARLLESIADLDLGVWGPYWQKLLKDSPLRKKAVDKKVNYDQWVKIFNASKINLVIHYQDGRIPCYQASPKLFEAMACGSFVLCDRQKDVQVLFKDREHLVFFDSKEDLRSKIKYYLEHTQEREQIAKAGCREVQTKHQYQDRIKQMLEDLIKNNES